MKNVSYGLIFLLFKVTNLNGFYSLVRLTHEKSFKSLTKISYKINHNAVDEVIPPSAHPTSPKSNVDTNTKKYLEISKSQIEKIKEKVNIVEIIQSYNLEKYTVTSATNAKACCPFHDEKTPSFHVDGSPSRNIFKCFGCGVGGDVFTFVKLKEDLDYYMDAVKKVALNHLSDPDFRHIFGFSKLDSKFQKKNGSQTQPHDIRPREHEVLYQINKQTAAFYNSQIRSVIGGKARYYLKSRSIPMQIVKEFHLGYATPEKRALVQYLQSLQFSAQDILDSGVAYLRKDTQLHHDNLQDRFSNRLLIPIFDSSAQVIAFGARTLSELDPPSTTYTSNYKPAKYINSPESNIFKKSNVLFNLNKIDNKQAVFVVEGYLDVIGLQMMGISNVVSSMGTSLSLSQLLLVEKCPNIILLLDNDSAGYTALKRICSLLSASKEKPTQLLEKLSIATLPNSIQNKQIKDPFDYISFLSRNSNTYQKAKAQFENTILNETLLHWKDWYIQEMIQTTKQSSNTNTTTTTTTKNVVQSCAEQITTFLASTNLFLNEVDRSHYVTQVATKILLQYLFPSSVSPSSQSSTKILLEQLQNDLLTMIQRKVRHRTAIQEEQKNQEQRKHLEQDNVVNLSQRFQKRERKQETKEQQQPPQHFHGIQFTNEEDQKWIQSTNSHSSSSPTNSFQKRSYYQKKQQNNFLVYGREKPYKNFRLNSNDEYNYYQNNQNIYFNSKDYLGSSTKSQEEIYQQLLQTTQTNQLQLQKQQHFAEVRLLQNLILYSDDTRDLLKVLMESNFAFNFRNAFWTCYEYQWLFHKLIMDTPNQKQDVMLHKILSLMNDDDISIPKSQLLYKLWDHLRHDLLLHYNEAITEEEEEEKETIQPSTSNAILDSFFQAIIHRIEQKSQQSQVQKEDDLEDDVEMIQLNTNEAFLTIQKCILNQQLISVKQEWMFCNQILFQRLTSSTKEEEEEEEENSELLKNQDVVDMNFIESNYHDLITLSTSNSPSTKNTLYDNTTYFNMNLAHLKTWSKYLGNAVSTTSQQIQSLQESIRRTSNQALLHGIKGDRDKASSSIENGGSGGGLSKSHLKLFQMLDEFTNSLEEDSDEDNDVEYTFGADSFDSNRNANVGSTFVAPSSSSQNEYPTTSAAHSSNTDSYNFFTDPPPQQQTEHPTQQHDYISDNIYLDDGMQEMDQEEEQEEEEPQLFLQEKEMMERQYRSSMNHSLDFNFVVPFDSNPSHESFFNGANDKLPWQ